MKRTWMGAAVALAYSGRSGLDRHMRNRHSHCRYPASKLPRMCPARTRCRTQNLVYKVVSRYHQNGSQKSGDVNPGLTGIARYFNTLAKDGVPAGSPEDRSGAAWRCAAEIIQQNEAFKARNNGNRQSQHRSDSEHEEGGSGLPRVRPVQFWARKSIRRTSCRRSNWTFGP